MARQLRTSLVEVLEQNYIGSGAAGRNTLNPGRAFEMHESELSLQAVVDPYEPPMPPRVSRLRPGRKRRQCFFTIWKPP